MDNYVKDNESFTTLIFLVDYKNTDVSLFSGEKYSVGVLSSLNIVNYAVSHRHAEGGISLLC